MVDSGRGGRDWQRRPRRIDHIADPVDQAPAGEGPVVPAVYERRDADALAVVDRTSVRSRSVSPNANGALASARWYVHAEPIRGEQPFRCAIQHLV